MEKEEIRIKQRYKIEKVLGQGGFGVTYLAMMRNFARK